MARIVALLAAILLAPPASSQTTDAAFPTSAGRMYAASTSQAWTAVLKLLDNADIKTEVKDEDGRFLITRPIQVDAKRFGFALTDVLANASNGRVKLHIFVPKFIEPARVYVGSTLTVEIAAQYSSGKGQMLLYSQDAFGDWFLEKVSKQLGMPAYRIPQRPDRRAKLARSLMHGVDDACVARIESGAQPRSADPNTWTAPKKLHDVPMVYPRTAANLSVERRFMLKMTIGEDGFPWPIGVADGTPDDEFAITALGSVPLWRFTPLIIDGCPAPTPALTMPVVFTVR